MITVKEQYLVNKNGRTVNIVLSKEDYFRLLKYIDKLENIIRYNKTRVPKKILNESWNTVKRNYNDFVPKDKINLVDFL